ncbi:MAG: VCBS repeat-containing protein, partial [Verrucomicrobiota bacterium]
MVPSPAVEEEPWPLHVIDDAGRGADGVRLGDVNGDGFVDVVKGWEESGETRLYLHPGFGKAKERWPRVVLGAARSVEDAVMVDLDGDGQMEVVSSCEGNELAHVVHARRGGGGEGDDAWDTFRVGVTQGRSAWMMAYPLKSNGKEGADLVVGSKKRGETIAFVGGLFAPADHYRKSGWSFQPWYESASGWIMSLIPWDADGDGDEDVLVSDRKGGKAGVFWLENSGANHDGNWPIHRLGAMGREVMFLALADVDENESLEVLAAVKPAEIHWLSQGEAEAGKAAPWRTKVVPLTHAKGVGTAKGIAVADMNGDGRKDLVASFEKADSPKRGVIWLEQGSEGSWTSHDVSGPKGIKFDQVRIVDLDGDGDQDVLTCEERHHGRGL